MGTDSFRLCIPHPNVDRATALGLAIALNLAALGALTVMQPSFDTPTARTPESNTLVAEWIEVPLPAPPPPVAPPRLQRASTTPVAILPQVIPIERSAPVDFATAEPTAIGLPAFDATVPEPIGPTRIEGVAAKRNAGVALPNPSAPPYPIAAIRKRREGTVLLEIAVDANGAATDVRVIAGSGHRELDRSAREHVLTAWTFQPALRDGVPVAARVRIPIQFSLAHR